MEEAIAANRVRLCAFCAKRDGITNVVTDDADVDMAVEDAVKDVNDTVEDLQNDVDNAVEDLQNASDELVPDADENADE